MKEFVVIVLGALLLSLRTASGIRFMIAKEECLSHEVKYNGDTVHVSFVILKSEGAWSLRDEGVDLVVKGPSDNQIEDIRGKTSEKFGHFSYYDQHAKDEHINPLLEQIEKLEEALYNIQFEQHWLEIDTKRQAQVNEGMSKRALYKAFWESTAMIGISCLQVYLMRRLFERKLGTSRV